MQHAAPQSVISSDGAPVGPEAAAARRRRARGRRRPVRRRPRAAGWTPVVRDGRKVGRNEPCPCGSGKKYKHCHGQLAREA